MYTPAWSRVTAEPKLRRFWIEISISNYFFLNYSNCSDSGYLVISILTKVASVPKVLQSAWKPSPNLCLNDLVVEPPHEAGLRVGLRSTQDLLGNLVLHNFHHLGSDVMKIFVFVDILGIIVFSLMKLIFNYLEWTESRGKYEMWLLENVMII